MANPQIFGAGIQGKSPAVTAMRRRNVFYDYQAEEDRTRVAIYGRPGLDLFTTFGETRIRGMRAVDANLYAVHKGTLYKVLNDGTKSALGTLDTTTGDVFLVDNGTYVMLVDGTSGYSYNTSTSTFAKITDGDFPAQPNSVAYVKGYFMVSNTATPRQFAISSLDDPTAWDALDFSTADSDPDSLVAVYNHQGLALLMGEVSLEYWGFTGAADFPFGRVTGSTFGWGLAARASLQPWGTQAICLGRNKLGEVSPVVITGGEPQRVGTSDLDFLINGYSATSDAVGYSFTLNGHSLYLLTFPTAKASWVYDGATALWYDWRSYGLTQFRGMTGAYYNNAVRFGDFTNGNIYTLNQATRTDNGEAIEIELISRKLYAPNNVRSTLREVQVDFEEGVGLTSGQGSSPQAMLSVSRDKGHAFGTELWASIGAIGDYTARARWLRLGLAREFTLRLRITDPIPVTITGEALRIEAGMN